jgi:hypothetical protein
MTMNPAPSVFNHIVAFDAGKHTLAVHILPGDERQTIPSKPKAIRQLLIAQKRHNAKSSLGPLLVICEATSGYERHLLEICVGSLGSPPTELTGRASATSPNIGAFWRKPIRSMRACSPFTA